MPSFLKDLTGIEIFYLILSLCGWIAVFFLYFRFVHTPRKNLSVRCDRCFYSYQVKAYYFGKYIEPSSATCPQCGTINRLTPPQPG